MEFKMLRVIECPALRGDIRTLAACEKCEHHGGIREVRPAGQLKTPEMSEGLPASYQVLCRIPKGIMVKGFPVEHSVETELAEAARGAASDIRHEG